MRLLAVGLTAAIMSLPLPGRTQDAPIRPTGIVAAEQQLEALGEQLQAAFNARLETFDRGIESRPFDVALRVERCRFIDEVSYQYEYEDWIDGVYELGETCDQSLQAEFSRHPEVVLRGFEYLYGQDLLDAAGPYDYPANRPGWTEGQLARLYEMLATAAESTGHPDAGVFARVAVELDATSTVRILAAESFAAEGMHEQAIAVLESPRAPTTQPADAPWNAVRELALLASLGERERLLRLYEQFGDGEAYYYDTGLVARSLRDVGEFGLAREEFAAAAEVSVYNSIPLFEWFEFELEHGTGATAFDAYERLRAAGWIADPLGANRVALFFKDPSLPWQARDWLALAGILAATLAVGLAAAAAIAPIHYRGAVLRARQLRSPDTQGWRLRHAWYALFAMGMASVLALYGTGAIDFASISNMNQIGFGNTMSFARYFLFEEMFMLALLVPVCFASANANRFWLRGSWSIARCALVAVGVALLFRLPLLAYLLVGQQSMIELVSDSLVWEYVGAARTHYGVFVALWLIAVVAPIAEEVIFRGILLTSFSKNVSFALANTMQAGLFALIHFDPGATPILFLIGLVAGFLARRSGGLLAPILLHGAFNLILGVFVLVPGLSD